jgi:hypothetical protein
MSWGAILDPKGYKETNKRRKKYDEMVEEFNERFIGK